MPPSVRVNGAMGSFAARTAAIFAPYGGKDESSPRCVHSTDAIHTISTSTRVSFGDRFIVLSLVKSVCNALSRRPARFGDPLAPLQGVFSPAMVAIEQLTSDAPVTHPVRRRPRSKPETRRCEVGQGRLPRPLVKRRRFDRPETSFITRKPKTTTPFPVPSLANIDLAILPPQFDARRLFARRGLPLWASPRSPPPVKTRKEASLGSSVVE